MRRVIVESPYAGDVEANVAYARRCLRDCLLRGEAPLASHLLYTQPGILDDDVPDERALGIEAGLVWGALADATVVYMDRGVSGGMAQGVERAEAEGRPVEFRWLGPVRVVFLDIDGVLNSMPFLAAAGPHTSQRPELHIDAAAVARLQRLIDATGAAVVLSSTWRRFYALDAVQAALTLRGARFALLDATPFLPDRERGDEVLAWLAEHPEVEAFVCLDDDADFGACMDRLVQTSFRTGLTDEHVDAAIALLRSPTAAAPPRSDTAEARRSGGGE